ncbi:MAG: S1 RNA-binding domain-containing protein, partial [Myxococcales bacterium]|nr:S1 RNA-binding domain-containing protein [Myxococcales bacterium]
SLDGAVLLAGCATAWAEQGSIESADAWASWAAWAAREPKVNELLGADPIDRARALLPDGDHGWAAVWRRLWALAPGDGELAAAANAWLYARRRPPALFVSVWEELLAGLERAADRALLLLMGARWLRGREDRPEWPTVWRTLVGEPGALPLGIDRRALLRVGHDWVTGRRDAGFVGVFEVVLDGSPVGSPERAELLALGRSRLAEPLPPADWARLWRRLFAEAGPTDDALIEQAMEWCLAHEDEEDWAFVWHALLQACPSGHADRARLIGWGRAWLAGREAMGAWPFVLERLLEERVRDADVLQCAADWLEAHPEQPAASLAARLLTVATAAVPCDAIAGQLSAWLDAQAEGRTADGIHALLLPIAWDGLDRRGWGPGWVALLAHDARRRAAEARVWASLSAAAASGETLTGRATEVVKGGLIVDLGVPAFMPASQIERGVVHDRSPYVGRNLVCRVVQCDVAARRVVVSRAAVLEAQRAHLLATLQAGQWVDGTVERLTEFGAFVDLGGLDALLHVSEMSFGHLADPSQKVRCGQRVRARVLSIDAARAHVSLSFKDPKADPWLHVPARYRPNDWVTGTVSNVVQFGAFIELEEGVDGLLH